MSLALASYCILGDGCNMEGISTEACSLAGHWGLGKLIALYDDNGISIDGHTDISFTEDVSKRFEALGWHTLHVKVRAACVVGKPHRSLCPLVPTCAALGPQMPVLCTHTDTDTDTPTPGRQHRL